MQLDEVMAEVGKPLDVAVSLELPDAVVVERVSGRWIHRPSGRAYHAAYAPYVSNGQCLTWIATESLASSLR